jgi:hypothetical protein
MENEKANGVRDTAVTKYTTPDWEIVEAGGRAYIGLPYAEYIFEDGVVGEVFLRPIFDYNYRAQQTARGLETARLLLPSEGIASATKAGSRLQWSKRTRLGDLDEQDQAMFEKLIADTFAAIEGMRAQRAGVELAPSSALERLRQLGKRK